MSFSQRLRQALKAVSRTDRFPLASLPGRPERGGGSDPKEAICLFRDLVRG
jgi:hypothetical protein